MIRTWMNVLSTNLIKVASTVYECGNEFQALSVTAPQTYTVNLTDVRTADVDYNITSGSAIVSAVWNGNNFTTGVVTGTEHFK